MLPTRALFRAFATACLVAVTVLPASSASAARVWHTCHVEAVWDGSTELPYYSAHCIEPLQINTALVRAFIVPTTDRERAARFFNVAMTSLLSGKLLNICVETNEIANCGSVDCRTAIYFGLANK